MGKIKVLILVFFIGNSLNAQVFKGFNSFKKIIEYEGQRYLMEDIFQITSVNFDKLKIDKTIEEIDDDEGFMLVVTSYVFNDKRGVVITSFNSTSFSNNQYQFVNVHLTDEEFEKLNITFKDLLKIKPKINEHKLRKFNTRLIVDVSTQFEGYYTLWVDYHNRHTFKTLKWEKMYKRYKKFTAQ